MSNPSSTPSIVKLLGYGGLIPFIGLALLSLTQLFPREIVNSALLSYAATILSFVAALHWGFAMTIPSLSENDRIYQYSWSVVPPLLAWLALLVSPTIGAVILIAGFIANLWQDLSFYKPNKVDLPKWYLPLRIRLTIIAVICISSTLINQ
jgi:uncharacterized membrane protein